MKYLLLSFFGFLLLFIIFLSHSTSYGTSPSISNQKIKDGNGDWKPLTQALNIDNCKIDINNYKQVIHPEIDSVNFFSNGKTLNTTLWFNTPLPYNQFANLSLNKNYQFHPNNSSFLEFSSNSSIKNSERNYGFSLNIFSSNEGIAWDYFIILSWDDDHKWQTIIGNYAYDVEPQKKTYINRYVDADVGENYVSLNLDLNSVNYPDKYQIAFYIMDIYNKGDLNCQLIDTTEAYIIPDPDFDIKSIPTLFLKQGEKKSFDLIVKSNAAIDSKVSIIPDYTFSENKKIQINTYPKDLLIPANGLGHFKFEIVSSSDTAIDQFDQPLYYTAYSDTGLINAYTGDFFNEENKSKIFGEYFTLPIIIEKMPSFEDYLTYILNVHGNIIKELAAVLGAIGTIIGGILIIPKKFKEYHKKQK